MRQLTLNISDDLLNTIARYSEAQLETFKHGSMTAQQREETRSYAAEIALALLIENPQEFGFKSAMDEIKRKENER